MNIIEKLRSYKIPHTNGMVLFDWLATLIGAIILANFYGKTFSSYLIIFIFLIIISIPIHYIFDIPTVTNYYLGISMYPN